ncbi:sensor histidine kinase [Umezawaea endophytica]|uniref:histidine kinase n=1 Tax=Umezawaea endophytica TaxID=1654476 RepID=A0A9X2VRM2_9PSEU|nr:histidine kinase [Umezawaea endophytica]MCS7480969.1 histidine kinase [Umezawaea endophytica]
MRQNPPWWIGWRETALVVGVLAVGAVPGIFGELVPLWTVVILAVVGSALVVLRTRWPLACLLGTIPLYALPTLVPMLCTAVIAFTAGRRSRPLWRFWLAVAATGAAGLSLSLLTEEERTGELLAVAVGSFVFLIGIPALAGTLLGYRRPMVRLLKERNEYLERARELTAAQARVDERTRIAGEMHDLLGHRLSLISMHAGALELGTADASPKISGQAVLLRTTAATALAELRQILTVLGVSSDGLDEHTGTRADLTELVQESRHAGVDVDLVWSGGDLDDVDARTRYAVHRAVREGLTNVHRHAPTARATVEVRRTPDRVLATVVNTPETEARRTPPGSRRGLAGVEERSTLLGGSFSARAMPDRGFRLAVELPVRPAGQAPDDVVPVLGAEPPEVITAQVLTMPRLIGTGCLAVLLASPFVIALVGVVISLVVR